MKFGSLFSGIGGLDLGLERAGMECAWQVEIDDYCRRVLTKHWPTVPKFRDVREVHGVAAHAASTGTRENEPRVRCESQRLDTRYEAGCIQQAKACSNCLPSVDLICGGFPCQPFSVAGKRRGTADDRHLWPEMLRIIDELRPAFVLGENVPGLIPMALDTVLDDLEAIGYEATTITFPAASLGAWHRRDRLWIMAYASWDEQRWEEQWSIRERIRECRQPQFDSHTNEPRSQGRNSEELRECAGQWTARTNGALAADSTPELSHGNGRTWNGRSESADEGWWKSEPSLGRVANGVPNRVDRLRGLGNAVVPQVAEFIGRMILSAQP